MANWKLNIDLTEFWRDAEIPVDERIRHAYAALVDSGWMDVTTAPVTLSLLFDEWNDLLRSFELDDIDLDELVEDFHDIWDAVYDQADVDRVLISTVV